MSAEIQPALLTTREAGEYLSLGRTTLLILERSGELVPLRIGRRTKRYSREQLDDFIRQREAKAQARARVISGRRGPGRPRSGDDR